MNTDNLSHGDKIILNALIMGGIAFFSTLPATGYPPTMANVYSAGIAMFLALLTQLKGLTTDKEPPNLGMLI